MPREGSMDDWDGESCFLVPGPVRMNSQVLTAMSAPVMTARGPEYKSVMAELNHLLRLTFNLAHLLKKEGGNLGLEKMDTVSSLSLGVVLLQLKCLLPTGFGKLTKYSSQAMENLESGWRK